MNYTVRISRGEWGQGFQLYFIQLPDNPHGDMVLARVGEGGALIFDQPLKEGEGHVFPTLQLPDMRRGGDQMMHELVLGLAQSGLLANPPQTSQERARDEHIKDLRQNTQVLQQLLSRSLDTVHEHMKIVIRNID